VGFDRELQAVLMGELGQVAGVIVRPQIGDGAAHIPKKAFRNFGIRNDAATEAWQIWEQIVAAAVLELCWKAGRPVLIAVFPTVDVGGGKCLFAGRDAGAPGKGAPGKELGEEGGEMGGDGFLAQLVALEAAAFWRGRMISS